MKKRKIERFNDWRKRIDSLRIDGNGLGGIVFAKRKAPTPDREECSSYVDFFYRVGTETCVLDLIYRNSELRSENLRDLAIGYLNEALRNYEAIPDPRIQTQFRLFPRENQQRGHNHQGKTEVLPISYEQIRYFLDQRGGTLEEWGGVEGIAHYLNPQ